MSHSNCKFVAHTSFEITKSKELQKIVFSKYQNGDTSTKIYRDLNGGFGLTTIKRWCQVIRRSGSIQLSSPPSDLRIIRTKANIQKINNLFTPKKIEYQLEDYRWSLISLQQVSGRRILKCDLGLKSHKIVAEPSLSDGQKNKRKSFTNWIRTNFRKKDTWKVLFSDEKPFDIDGVYNVRNTRI